MMNRNHILFLYLIFFLIFSGCLSAPTAYNNIAPGIWRGVLEFEKVVYPVADKDSIFVRYEQFKEGDLPFNFEVIYTDAERFYVEIHNGTERIRCDSIQYGRNKLTARDTVNIFFPEYDSYIHVDVRGEAMQGEWIMKNRPKAPRIPFTAKAGQDFRFTSLAEPPVADISGEWAALFDVDQEKPYKAIGEFKQNKNHLTGTFRTETGDYRYLEGTVQGRKFWMSCFDGSHAFIFSGSIRGDSLQGEFRSGKTHRELWTAWKDPNFKLADPGALATATGDISFAVTTPEGQALRFPSADFDGKVKVFTIMGTWCPNCRDEQKFLKAYLEENPDLAQKMSVVSFSFERHADISAANTHLMAYKKQMGIPFAVVYGGKADKAEAQRVFPALSKVVAFPTIMVLDKKNKVRHVHTGFDGPATSKYATFKKEFDTLIRQLAAE
jgi:thiol-disulfide isomerase/thioredoxin